MVETLTAPTEVSMLAFVLDSEAATEQEQEKDAPRGTEPMSFAIQPEVEERLAEFRKKGGAINVGAVCNAAILVQLERLEKTGLADLTARLRVESDRRRGAPYRQGHLGGQQWAKQMASWAEICYYARFGEADVRIENVKCSNKGRKWLVPTFKGLFVAPAGDYGRCTWDGRGAPAYVGEYQTGKATWVTDLELCDQYWRGWLAGVLEVWGEVSEELQPINLRSASPAGAAKSLLAAAFSSAYRGVNRNRIRRGIAAAFSSAYRGVNRSRIRRGIAAAFSSAYRGVNRSRIRHGIAAAFSFAYRGVNRSRITRGIAADRLPTRVALVVAHPLRLPHHETKAALDGNRGGGHPAEGEEGARYPETEGLGERQAQPLAPVKAAHGARRRARVVGGRDPFAQHVHHRREEPEQPDDDEH
jgi:hypothetical protein